MTAETQIENLLAEVAEKDARIAELERALKSCASILLLDIREREKFIHVAKEAVAEADKALSV